MELRDYQKSILTKINNASNAIVLKSRRSGASWMVANSAVFSMVMDEWTKTEKRKRKIKNILNDIK